MIETTQHSDDFLNRAVLGRLADGPSTPEALAAALNCDLARVRVALASLVATGRAAQVGILYELARRAA